MRLADEKDGRKEVADCCAVSVQHDDERNFADEGFDSLPDFERGVLCHVRNFYSHDSEPCSAV